MLIVTCPNCLRIMMDGSILNTELQQEKDAMAMQMTCKCKEVIRVSISVLHQGEPIGKGNCPHLNLSIYDADHQQCIDCGHRVRWQGELPKVHFVTKPQTLNLKPEPKEPTIKPCNCGALGAMSHVPTCPRHIASAVSDVQRQSTTI